MFFDNIIGVRSLILLTFTVLTGCGSGGGSNGTPTITVVMAPKTASLTQGGTQQFSATVGGTTNTAVTWSANGGSITSGGFYTAPATSGTYTVTVTTQATPAASDTATVTVTTATPATLAWRGVNLSGAEFGQDKPMPGTYGTQYIYPSANEAAYFKSKGMNIVRLPFRWERLQPTFNQAFDVAELGHMHDFVDAVTANGMTVLLDVQNFAHYGGAQLENDPLWAIGSTNVPVTAFSNLWSRLATEFKGNSRVMFGLMNEPHDIDVSTWVSAANQAIVAIRATGATNTITVPGVSWTGAWSWTNNTWQTGGTYNGDSNAVAMLNVTDSGNNLLFEVHQYLDTDYSGQYLSGECVYDSAKLVNFTAWLKANNKKGLLGEIGAPSNAACNLAVANVLSHVQANADVWAGWMWWSAGPWWIGSWWADHLSWWTNNYYPLSLEPTWNGDYMTGTPKDDKPQMSVLAPYLN
jgi:endoglucanase